MKTIATIFIIAISVQMAVSQEKLLTFSEAVTIAMENNVTVKQNENNLKLAKVNETAAFGNLAPSVSASSTAAQRVGNTFNQQDGNVYDSKISFFSGSINADMDIFRGLNNFNTVKSTQFRTDAELENLEWSKQTVITNVATQYLNVLVNQEQVNIAKENLEFQQKTLDLIKTEVLLGRRPESDELNQEALVKNAELLHFRAISNLRNSKMNLALVMNIDPTSNFTVTEPKVLANTEDIESVEITSLQETALQNRGDYQNSLLLEKSSMFSAKAAKSNFMPSLTAFFGAGSQYNYIDGIPNQRSFEDQMFVDNTFYQYGLSLSVPIFSNMSSRSRYIQSKINYENARLQTEGLENTIKSNVMTAQLNYQDAIVALELSNSQMEAAELSYKINTERYNLGMIDQITYAQAVRDYFNARSDMANARITLIFRKILLQSALGKLSAEDFG